jgi:hypothetical protein
MDEGDAARWRARLPWGDAAGRCVSEDAGGLPRVMFPRAGFAGGYRPGLVAIANRRVGATVLQRKESA